MELDLLHRALESGLGWYGIAAACVVLAVRAYRSDAVQALLPVVAQWHRLRPWVRLSLVFVAALLSAWVAALLAGQTIWAALAAAVPVALTAIAGHKSTQAIGHAHTHARVRENLAYEPSSLRTVLDPVFPIDRQAVASANATGRRAQ